MNEDLHGLIKDIVEAAMWAACVITLFLPFWLLLG